MNTEEFEALIDTLVDDASVGIALLDRALRVVRVNDRFAGMTGREAEEHRGREIADLFPALSATLTPIVLEVLENGTGVRDRTLSVRGPDENPRPHVYQFNCYPVKGRSGACFGVVLSAIDITERRRQEDLRNFYLHAAEVLGSSLDYQTTLTAVARLLVPLFADWCSVDIVDDDGTIRRLAVEARDAETAALIRDIRARFPFDPDSPNGVPWVIRTGQPELITDITEEGVETYTVSDEHRELLRRLGLVSVVRVPLVARGRTLGALTLATAHSGRRFGPEAIGSTQVLARRAALAIDNGKLYHQAQEALRVRQDFMMAVSHDLRTPLTPIRGFAQLLQRRTRRAGSPDDTLLEGLATIDANAARMELLVEQLLDVSRVQSGRPLELDCRPCDLVEIVRRAIDVGIQPSERHSIRLDTGPASLIGEWDPHRLERVVWNLLGNAVKYSPAGGAIHVRVWEETDPDDGTPWAVLAIRDQGIGIPAPDLPLVLEPFHRARNVGAISGTGIGLAGAKQIVEQHGGRITVESTEGQGTTMTIRLPRTAPTHDMGDE